MDIEIKMNEISLVLRMEMDTGMELEEIYAHFRPPTEDEKIIFTKRALKRMKKVTDKTKKTIDYIIKMRDGIAEHVFKYNDNIKVNTPVNFRYVINNIQNQLYIQSNSLVDVTFAELYEMLDKTYEHLSSMKYVKPTELFHIMYICVMASFKGMIFQTFSELS